MDCDQCGCNLAGLPYTCKRCGEVFCSEHRLPESHDCQQLKIEKAERALKREAGKDTGPWFNQKSENPNIKKSAHPDVVKVDNTDDRLTKSLLLLLALIVLGGIAVGVFNLF